MSAGTPDRVTQLSSNARKRSQLWCIGDEDFVYYVIADNPIGDSWYYPDSGKWAVRKEGDETVILKGKGAETDYFDGEE